MRFGGRSPVRGWSAFLAALAFACGGGGGSPTAPPPPGDTHDVVAVVFLDENGNARLDAEEGFRLPGVEVTIAGRSARTEVSTGRAVVSGVPAGTHSLGLRVGSLPPYFEAGAAVSLRVPQAAGADATLPVTLPVGGNKPYEYMAFGDSISLGAIGSSDGRGYRSLLEERLRAHFGRGNVPNRGLDGSRSDAGAARIAESLERMTPGFTLILYGTNDWNDLGCRSAPPCYTIDSLRSIIAACRAASSLPVLATIPPVNTLVPRKAPPERQQWVSDMNERVRALAREEGVPLADVHRAMLDAGDLGDLFLDHVHPTDLGYEVIAETFFETLASPQAGAARFGP